MRASSSLSYGTVETDSEEEVVPYWSVLRRTGLSCEIERSKKDSLRILEL
jgi:hypothetical protein